MRTIDADALVNRIVFHTDMPSEYKEQVEDTISDIPTIKTEQQWVPFSEKMPDEYEWVGTKLFGTTISDTILITFDVDGERFVKPMSLQNGKLSPSDTATMDAFYKEWKMVAWTEMPKPWEGGASETN